MSSALPIAVASVAGMLVWTFSEYVLHRWFHTARGANLASREHLVHHVEPPGMVDEVHALS